MFEAVERDTPKFQSGRFFEKQSTVHGDGAAMTQGGGGGAVSGGATGKADCGCNVIEECGIDVAKAITPPTFFSSGGDTCGLW